MRFALLVSMVVVVGSGVCTAGLYVLLRALFGKERLP